MGARQEFHWRSKSSRFSAIIARDGAEYRSARLWTIRFERRYRGIDVLLERNESYFSILRSSDTTHLALHGRAWKVSRLFRRLKIILVLTICTPRPILLNVKRHNAFEADFVLATLLEPVTDVSASGESQQQYSQMSSSQQRGKGTQGSSSVHPTGAQRSTLGARSVPSQSSPMNSSTGLRTPPPLTPAKRRASELVSDNEPHAKRMKSLDGSAEPLVWGRQLVGSDVNMSDDFDEQSDVPPSP